MELGSILHFLEGRTILVTGATGFLAKSIHISLFLSSLSHDLVIYMFVYLFGFAVFVEKILRVQPNVKKLYLLLRAKDSESAAQRFRNEVMNICILLEQI